MSDDARLARERGRILAEYARRDAEIDPGRYAPGDPAERLLRDVRRRRAEALLRRAGRFPGSRSRCLEIGCGRGGWLGELRGWGVREVCLHGVDVDLRRLREAGRGPRLARADGGRLPFRGGVFNLVVASTVFTSILDGRVRRLVASEAVRVLRPGGALLWYDFAFDNPQNPHVRGIGKRGVRGLFPELRGEVVRVTLAPPVARLVVARSRVLAEWLERLPFLRTHLLGVLVRRKKSDR